MKDKTQILKDLENKTYTLDVYCKNCQQTYKERLPKGVQLQDCNCENCGCKTLTTN
jgi:hypothetical protein